jgi:hypothetical protein
MDDEIDAQQEQAFVVSNCSKSTDDVQTKSMTFKSAFGLYVVGIFSM